MDEHRWLVYALLSAASAALVAVFGRVGVNAVDPNLATTLRSVVMTTFLLAFVTATRGWGHLPSLRLKPVLIVLLSGLAGAASWLFYFNALRLADVSRVAPVDKLSTVIAVLLAVLFLGERPSPLNWCGVGLIVAGAYLVSLKPVT